MQRILAAVRPQVRFLTVTMLGLDGAQPPAVGGFALDARLADPSRYGADGAADGPRNGLSCHTGGAPCRCGRDRNIS
jgi:hypothetical protein